ncbi:NAD(P)H-hydrate dehydratase [Luteimonas lutimaris]|uniref:Bifunctional NAD(P)H-hydrate repair enzyme n=1 Tax=Luteimonas lutimaris TaxID=698645 RepID=A0ABP7MC84_9GAMM
MSGRLPLFDNAALRSAETRAATRLGDNFVLMQRAGLAAWHCVLAHWPQAQRLVVVCGPGNNGGDGHVLARHAREAGRPVRVLRLPGHEPRGDVAIRAEREYREAGGGIGTFAGALGEADVVVDALFGIGLKRAPDGGAAALVSAINDAALPVLALDAPSGVDADSGCVLGVAVRAMRTLQFLGAHAGLATGQALEHVGARELATLGIDDDILPPGEAIAEALDARALAGFLRPRGRNSHKGESGRVLCVGGDHGKGGAVLLCAGAALRTGAGLVDVATRAAHVPALLARRPEAMAHAMESARELAGLHAAADVVAVGPGLGQDAWGSELFAALVDGDAPLVIDADALNLLAAAPRTLRVDTVLTPHPGEAARLLSTSTVDVQGDRRAAAAALCERYGCVVVLKGAGTVVAAPGRRPRIIDAGNPGMAVGGMGDVLTGVIAALRAQGLDAFDAACCGALLHGAAGDAAARDGGERGLLPSDLFAPLRRLANP